MQQPLQMPRQTERQQAAQGLLHVYLALLATESEELVDSSLDFDSDSDFDNESQSSDDKIKEAPPSSAVLQNIHQEISEN